MISAQIALPMPCETPRQAEVPKTHQWILAQYDKGFGLGCNRAQTVRFVKRRLDDHGWWWYLDRGFAHGLHREHFIVPEAAIKSFACVKRPPLRLSLCDSEGVWHPVGRFPNMKEAKPTIEQIRYTGKEVRIEGRVDGQ